jgi:DNA-directed RNA polymerase
MINSIRGENGERVFLFNSSFNVQTQKRLGIIMMSSPAFSSLDSNRVGIVLPRYLPMLVPPQSWDNRAYYGAYLRLKAPILKHSSKAQMEAAKRANMKKVLEGLDYLGSTAWRINSKILEVALKVRTSGLTIGEIPPNEDLNIPTKEDYLRESLSQTEQESQDPNARKREYRMYMEWKNRIEKKNAELHSLRCDMKIKLSIAEQFLHDKFYFPHHLDFRGRAYPIPPNLSHLGSDLCRALMIFDEPKMLGESGLFWLKVHLANLWGNNKITFMDRVKWVDSHMNSIIDSATNPLSGEMWWVKAESPFQALATCFEIAAAMELKDPTRYFCRLPIHQDGSCNGLQHYAGLGRDESGGAAVNLVPSKAPEDVYTRVLEIVIRRIKEDSLLPEDHEDPTVAQKAKMARMVNGLVNRKVIKQTVMTSVYGVTKIGARAQIQARLTEMLTKDSSVISPNQEKELHRAAHYVAGLTLLSLQEVFVSAKQIMDWLALVSHLVAGKVSLFLNKV